MYLAAHKYNNAQHAENALKSAESYFKEKHDSQKAADQQTKYEKNMMKLSKDLISRNRTAANYHVLTAGSTFLSIVIPGVGSVLAGVAGIGALVGTIHDIYRMGKIKEGMFDNYYNVNELTRKVLEIKKQKCLDPAHYVEPDIEMFRRSVRNAICKAAGHSDVEAAADHIAFEYATFVHNKLFGPDPVKGDERLAYIRVVKMFNAPYDEKKKIPSSAVLSTKMKGG